MPSTSACPSTIFLIGGEPGSGKSVALSTIVAAAALDPTVHLTLLDGKHVELATWSLIADRFVGSDQEDAADALEELRDLMDLRYAMLVAERRRKLSPTDPEGLHVLVIDELAFYLRGGKKETRERFTELLRDLVSRGRAAGIIVVAATQKPSHEIVPTWIRDLFSFRLALRCTSSDASDTILGQGWAHQGFSAATIDPTLRGVGYLLAEGGTPTLLMTPYLSDEDVDAHRSSVVRTAADVMNAEERAHLLREVEQAGNCSHPIRLRGETVNLATGEVGESLLRVACKDRRHVVCPSCSYLYKADAWILVSSGLVGGKGIPELGGNPPATLCHD